MAVSKLILPINNGYQLKRLLQNFMVCGVQFVENWGVRSNYSLIGWCMSFFDTLIHSHNFRQGRKIIKPSPFLSIWCFLSILVWCGKNEKKNPSWNSQNPIHFETLKLNFVDSFAVYVRAAVGFARLNFSLFQGQNATVIRVYCKWIHPLLLMGCTTILSCSDCVKGFRQQTARQLKTMQWRSIQITVFTRAWQNLMISEHSLLSCNLEREYCRHVKKLWGAISSYYIQTAVNSVAWENSGHFLVSPSEKQVQKIHTAARSG